MEDPGRSVGRSGRASGHCSTHCGTCNVCRNTCCDERARTGTARLVAVPEGGLMRALLTGVALLLSIPAHAGSMSGNKLYEACQAAMTTGIFSLGLGYISGVIDSLETTPPDPY